MSNSEPLFYIPSGDYTIKDLEDMLEQAVKYNKIVVKRCEELKKDMKRKLEHERGRE